jgi:hypothetical protein
VITLKLILFDPLHTVNVSVLKYCDNDLKSGFAGDGLTPTVALIISAVHVIPAFVYAGVILNVSVIGTFVLFVNDPLILPSPLDPIPVKLPVLSLVQLYITEPAVTLLIKLIGVMFDPLHIVCDAMDMETLSVGLTTTVAPIGDPVQLPPELVKVGITVNVTDCGDDVLLIIDPEILPLPLSPKLVVTFPVLSLVQLYTTEPAAKLLLKLIWVMVEPLHID